MFAQLLLNGVINGCVLALAAAGFGLIYNTTRIFHIAHGAAYTGGAYIGFFLLVVAGWPLVPSVIVAAGLIGCLGIVAARGLYEPLLRRDASFLVLLLTSLGCYVVVVNIIALVFGSQNRLLDPTVHEPVAIGPALVSHAQVAQALIAVAVLLPVWLLIERSGWLRDLRAAGDNPALAEVLGVNLRRARDLAFGIGSALVGVAAVLAGLETGIDPYQGMSAFLLSAVAVIVGGGRRIAGPVLGAFVLGVLQGVAAWQASTRWLEAVTFGVLVVVLLVRPQGLLGKSRRLEEVEP